MERELNFRAFLNFGNLKVMIETVDVFASGNIGVDIEQMNEAIEKLGWKYNDDYEFENLTTGEKIPSFDVNCHDNGEDYFIISSNHNLMQSTGLKDKNGKDVYDSDRVKRRVHLVEGKDYMDYNCDVKWIGWSYALYIADKHLWPLDAITAKEIEVIGNAYEPSAVGV